MPTVTRKKKEKENKWWWRTCLSSLLGVQYKIAVPGQQQQLKTAPQQRSAPTYDIIPPKTSKRKKVQLLYYNNFAAVHNACLCDKTEVYSMRVRYTTAIDHSATTNKHRDAFGSIISTTVLLCIRPPGRQKSPRNQGYVRDTSCKTGATVQQYVRVLSIDWCLGSTQTLKKRRGGGGKSSPPAPDTIILTSSTLLYVA